MYKKSSTFMYLLFVLFCEKVCFFVSIGYNYIRGEI